MIPVFDSHLDLALNALIIGRDITLPLSELNASEKGLTDFRFRGKATVSLPEMRSGGVFLCVATALARCASGPITSILPEHRPFEFTSQDIAYAFAEGQFAYYRKLAKKDLIRIVSWREELSLFIDEALTPPPGQVPPLGVILALEGSDAVTDADEVPEWWDKGLRVASLVHYGMGRYAGGTGTEAGLTPEGRALLGAYDEAGIVLDVTHLSDPAFFQSLELFGGPVLASHNNCRHLVAGGRQFSDDQIRLLVSRGAVIGVATDMWMLATGWDRGRSDRKGLGMELLADHIDHICRLSGDTDHAAIGSDLDGGYGSEQTPDGLDSIADLQKLEAILAGRGYGRTDIEKIFFRNWTEYFRRHLPARDSDAAATTRTEDGT